MRIGINLLGLLPGMIGGVETYIRGLLDGLARIDNDNEYVIFANRENWATFEGFPENFKLVRCDFSARWTIRSLFLTRVLGEQLYLPRRAEHERLDVLHSPLDTTPLVAPCATVMTLHDLNFDAVPEATTALRRRIAKTLVRTCARRATAVVTVSQFSRREIIRKMGLSPERVEVVYNAPGRAGCVTEHQWPALARKFNLALPYVIAFSSLNPHKNLGRLLAAFAKLQPQCRWQLLIVGHLPRRGDSLPDLAVKHKIEQSVIFCGYLDDVAATLALQHARLLAFPSLYEGFGIPVIEAMNMGVPVACSNAAALPEVAGDAALLFDPSSANEIAAALNRLLTDGGLRESLIVAGYNNARRFSWTRSAEQTLALYERACRARRAGRSSHAVGVSARPGLRSGQCP